MSGTVVAGRYLLGKRVERTWLGERFLATDQDDDAQRELELWRAAGKQEDQLLRLVRREVEISDWLGEQKDVVRALAWGQLPDGWIYVVREASPGTKPVNLKQGPLDDRIWRVLNMCQLVQFLTEKGIVHRDICPAAFPEHASEDLRLARLYLARLDEVAEPWVGPWGLPHAEIRCAAPELLERPSEATPAADVFALGVLLFRAATGKWPYRGASLPQLMRLHLNVAHGRLAPPSPSDMRLKAPVPRQLEAICARAVAISPADRYATPGELAQALEDFLAVGSEESLTESASDLGALDLTGGDEPSAAEPAALQTEIAKIEVPDGPLIAEPADGPLVAEPADGLANSGIELNSEDLTPEEHLVLPELPDAPPPMELDLPEPPAPTPVPVEELLSAEELLTASDVGLTMQQGAIVLAVEPKRMHDVVDAIKQLDPAGVRFFLMDMSAVPHIGGGQLEALTAVFTLCEQKRVRSAMYSVTEDVKRMVALLELEAHVPDILDASTTEDALEALGWNPSEDDHA